MTVAVDTRLPDTRPGAAIEVAVYANHPTRPTSWTVHTATRCDCPDRSMAVVPVAQPWVCTRAEAITAVTDWDDLKAAWDDACDDFTFGPCCVWLPIWDPAETDEARALVARREHDHADLVRLAQALGTAAHDAARHADDAMQRADHVLDCIRNGHPDRAREQLAYLRVDLGRIVRSTVAGMES